MMRWWLWRSSKLIELPPEGSDEYRRIVAFFCTGCMLVEFFFFFVFVFVRVGEKAVEVRDTQRRAFIFFISFFLVSSSIVY